MAALDICDIGEERKAALAAEARSRGVSVSELVRRYIDEGIGRARADRARQAWIAESREGLAFEAEQLAKNGPSLARMAASLSHELVAMQYPVLLSTSIERPRQPSIVSSIGAASFSMNLTPASMLSGLPWNVVERAYTAPLPRVGAAPSAR